MASSTRLRVDSLMLPVLFKTLETVLKETPASCATSKMVTCLGTTLSFKLFLAKTVLKIIGPMKYTLGLLCAP